MAKVIPFKGVRYNTEKIGKISDVVTPPYDVIDDTEQKMFYDKSPYNIIRLELGYMNPTDTEKENRYTRAANAYQEWLDKKILNHESDDSLYLYEQQFSVNTKNYTRTGFFARVKLEDLATGKILPHEETLLKPKKDRLALMTECVANFSPVFGFYVDPEMTIDQEFEKIKEQKPEYTLTDEQGEEHRIWKSADHTFHQKVRSALEKQTLYIADGHHRYETALEYFRKNRDKYPNSEYVLMFIVNTYDPGMVVQPTHRVVHSLPDFSQPDFKNSLDEFFIVKEIDNWENADLEGILKEQQKTGRTAFIMGTKNNGFYLLILRDPDLIKQESPGQSPAWCRLDVAALQVSIFQKLLNLSPGIIARQENIRYTRKMETAIGALDQDAQLIFLMNPTKISQIIDVASSGDKMPQKSTYFYPKLLTGLVINDLTV